MNASADFSKRVELGRTGLQVSRLGLGAGYGVSQQACQRAFERGLNYWFWGSARTPGMAQAIRSLGSAHRSDLVIVLQCYVRVPSLIRKSVERGLAALNTDYADVLLLGWYDRVPSPKAMDVVEDLRRRGRFRHLALSTHRRSLVPELLPEGRYDAFHIRYNAAHTGAERDIFPSLPQQRAPGIVAFTCTRWGDLLNPQKMPPGEEPLSATDCYRFALTSPHVAVATCGPKNDEELEQALRVLDSGPLGEAELERVRRIGRHVYESKSVMDWFR
ncbi:MAG TPA: aldo/keto reductase [Polyangiaceae bacterium]|nr:aldo/keto reductase [Polyangiaceae bacterium]